METNSGSSQPYTGPVLLQLVLRMLCEVWAEKNTLKSWRKEKKKDRKSTNLSFPWLIHVQHFFLFFSLPKDGRGPSQPCLLQSV